MQRRIKHFYLKNYLKLGHLQAHSSSGEFPSITLSACDDDDDDEDDDDLFTIQRDTVLDVGEVTMIFDMMIGGAVKMVKVGTFGTRAPPLS